MGALVPALAALAALTRSDPGAVDPSEGAGGGVAFHGPVLVGSSSYTHFWMPSSLFRGAGDDLILSIDFAGDGKPCPPPHHPQNCSGLFRSRDLGRSWAPVFGDTPGLALPIPQRAEPGKTRTYNFEATASAAGGYEIFSAMWRDDGAEVERVSAESVMVPLLGFPPLAGPPAASGNVVRLRRRPTELLGTMYGRLRNSSHACKPFEGAGAPPWCEPPAPPLAPT